MSRENKLALIIGFGLVLFVGVLLSDHLSSHQRQVTSNLHHAIDPIETDRMMASVLVEYDTGSTVAEPPLVAASTTIEPASIVSTSTDDRLHVIAASETISSICRRWYGNEQFALALATFNNLPDPDRLVVGSHLVIPDRLILKSTLAMAPVTPTLPAADLESTAEVAHGTYTVQPGDTLSEIAQKLLGTTKATASIFELNRSVLPNMDALQVGMQLQYPLPPS